MSEQFWWKREWIRVGTDRGWGFKVDSIGDYMHRAVLSTPWGTLRLHRIMRSDADRHLHDHPWDFTSLLLSGGYNELLDGGCRECPRWSIVSHKAEDRHALVLDGPVTTLVLTGPIRRDWGFHTEDGWIHFRDYQSVKGRTQ
mgnify:CR=1 FL=1